MKDYYQILFQLMKIKDKAEEAKIKFVIVFINSRENIIFVTLFWVCNILPRTSPGSLRR
jgi:hypothetical protein